MCGAWGTLRTRRRRRHRTRTSRAAAHEWLAASAASHAPQLEAIPDLRESDTLVRALATGLSARPELASWLVTDGLIRRFVAATHAVAGGYSPREELGFLDPGGVFLVQHRQQGLVIAPSSFRRYDTLTEVFVSLDNVGLLRLYRRFEPLVDMRY